MKNNNTTVNGGIGFCGVLTIVFIVLKLMNIISWPWVWVLAPLWISILVSLIIVIGMLFFIVWVEKKKRN